MIWISAATISDDRSRITGLRPCRLVKQSNNRGALAYYINVGWIERDRRKLDGQPHIRETRLSVSFVLECLAQGMTDEQIAQDYPGFPPESVPEVLRFASEAVARDPRTATSGGGGIHRGV